MLVVRSAVVGPFAENTYLVGDSLTGEALLIDPGGGIERVLALREPGGLRVTRIFLTHGHVDHVAGCSEAKRLFSAPCQIHRADLEWLLALPQQGEMFGFEGPLEVPSVESIHQDGETLAVGEHVGRVIHTPGHSLGSCCLYFDEARTLFAGDTLFAGSVGRTDLPGGDPAVLERSNPGEALPARRRGALLPGPRPERDPRRRATLEPLRRRGCRAGWAPLALLPRLAAADESTLPEASGGPRSPGGVPRGRASRSGGPPRSPPPRRPGRPRPPGRARRAPARA